MKMIKVNLIGICCALMSNFGLQAQANLKFDVDTANFGKVYEGDTVRYEFGFTNIGTEDLIIKQAWPACGCTYPTFTEGVIKPGERGSIKIEFRSAGFAGHNLVKNIIVINNGPERYAVFRAKVVDKNMEAEILNYKEKAPATEKKKEKKSKKAKVFKPTITPDF